MQVTTQIEHQMPQARAIRLFAYYRSSTSYRVRIALNLKSLAYQTVPVNLMTREHQSDDYVACNPFSGVPMLEVDGTVYTQSMAILEWLDERFTDHFLLPSDIEKRFVARELAMAIATELHAPLNLSVLQYLRHDLGHIEAEVDVWYWHWLAKTFNGVEAKLRDRGAGDFLFDAPGYFEAVLIPQVYNARRFSFDMSVYPQIARIELACAKHPAFIAAHPDLQPGSPVLG